MDVVLNGDRAIDCHDRQNQQEINENLRKYRALLASSNTGAWEYFPEKAFLDCNSVYFSMLGRDIGDYNLTSAENLYEVWINLLHPDDTANATAKLKSYLANPEGMYENCFRMKHADGNWIWICSRGGFHEAEGRPRSLIGTHVDITRQKQAEDDIQRERVLLRTLIDNLPTTIYVKDAEGRKVIANISDVKTIGAKCEADVIGKTDLELFPNEIGLRGYQNDMDVLQSGEGLFDKEEMFFDSNGKAHWLQTTKVPIADESGKFTRILGIGHDITARKQTEEALNKLNEELKFKSVELTKQAEELKILNGQLIQQKEQELEKAIAQGKFEIASEVLHDIGNALVGFGSYLTRINRVVEKSNLDAMKNLGFFLKGQQDLIGNAIGADKAKALVAITEGIANTQTDNQKELSASITELLNIVSHIKEILSIQRQFVRAHSGVHDRKTVKIEHIIADCRSMLFASLDKKGVKLSVNVKQGDHTIKGDHTKLMQVILNILKNSLEAIDMEKEDKQITVSLDSTDEMIQLTVTDNGSGFDAETASHFFERGFTTKKSGTGLGLYNCKQIVESHAGLMELSSEGKGMGSVTMLKFLK